VDATLRAAEWAVVRVWDFEVGKSLSGVVERIADTLREKIDARGINRSSWQLALTARSGPSSPDSS
jgi:hypothetical protein